MKILCVGQAAYDITFPCTEPILENRKYRIYNRMECMGAPAANASYLCALWGADVSLMARVGDDLYGKEILHTLNHVGVDTTPMHVDKQIPTSISCIIANADKSTRTILNCPMKDESFPYRFPEEDVHVILMDGHELNASLAAIKQFPDALTILDAGTYKPEIMELIQSVDYLVCSEDFARQYTGITIDLANHTSASDTFQKLKEINTNHIVITLGDKGSVYEEHDQIHHIPAFNVNAIDTTGAGDIFHGAFAYCLNRNYSLNDIIRISSLSASISVERLGSQIAIPDLEEMRKRIRELHLDITLGECSS